ncbi:MAG TPA: hypothetical protein VIM58_07040 [Candidatus Methylacidiphilales bacterium]
MKKLILCLVLLGAIAPAVYLEFSYVEAKDDGVQTLNTFESHRQELARRAILCGFASMALGGFLFLGQMIGEEHRAHLHHR